MSRQNTQYEAAGYWTRPKFGRSLQVERLKSLTDSPAHVQLAAALLRCDCEAATAAIEASHDGWLGQRIFDSELTGSLCSLIYQRVLDLELGDRFSSLKLLDGASLLDILRSGAAGAAIMFEAIDQRFVSLISQLGSHSQNIICLKGTTIARTLYQQPHHRLSQDFDFLVENSSAAALLEHLQAMGFSAVWNNPGYCHQSGVGPVGSLARLSLSPSDELELCHNISLMQDGCPYIELKFDPFDTGLKARETDRFFQQTAQVPWKSITFRAPGLIDHLLLELAHLHKHGFQGWHWLYDMHLLVGQMREDMCWQELLRRCRVEGLELSAWAGLELLRDRLHSPIPDGVLLELKPASRGLHRRIFTFTVNTEFLWNSASLPMLLLNACFLGNSRRKLQALKQTIWPRARFLSDYYSAGDSITWNYPLVLMLHWLVLLLPGGLVRRTFGRLIWKADSTPQQPASNKPQPAKTPSISQG